jgi:hypothetical protein
MHSGGGVTPHLSDENQPMREKAASQPPRAGSEGYARRPIVPPISQPIEATIAVVIGPMIRATPR